ncbi:sugar nucleotide-binding protein, partial [Streptomyces sp. NEAU-Y11]|uniref:sugar nucleotide-binding protein n=1 Tax=Streptomyces cucumeris TaxID=2962890 RepID=UPI0020C8ACB8
TPSVSWHRLDFRDPRALDKVIDAVEPSVVINASSGDADWTVTADGPVRLAQSTARRGIRLVHVSSDAVFFVFHLAGPDALSRYDLGVLIARRDGIDPARLSAGRRADTQLLGALDVRLDSRATQRRLNTRLRGARDFLDKG